MVGLREKEKLRFFKLFSVNHSMPYLFNMAVLFVTHDFSKPLIFFSFFFMENTYENQY